MKTIIFNRRQILYRELETFECVRPGISPERTHLLSKIIGYSFQQAKVPVSVSPSA